jgi:hypothetical protein
LTCNSCDRQTLVVEGVNLGVTTFIAHLEAALSGQVHFLTLFVELAQFVDSGLLVQRRQDAHGHALERSRQVMHDMPPNGDLHCTWSAARCGAGVDAISVPADDLHPTMII